ncbi:hypothetical protein J4E89_005106 [Alternaria sp. Ai002NY15]|nr:hypothetical protein J4E89_005106 [Alternaria sp. Ai002NY15]
MPGDSESLTEKRKVKIALAELKYKCLFGQLNASQRLHESETVRKSERALLQAEDYPKIALVDVLWRVECFLWNGEKLVLCTSDEKIADECRIVFGWRVDKEANKPTYKYSKSFYESSKTEERPWRQWINPSETGQIGASFMKSESKEQGQPRATRKLRWERCPVQRGLWLAMELRRPFAKENKTEPLDLEGSLLPKEYAKRLMKDMGVDWKAVVAPDDVKEWIKKSAANGPEGN